ncbi:hypothetical protein BDK88_4200 [Natrinema hispanicum]|uniref:Uncharacterized protein n=1 Tax=Natrinema hispanicum TaxID=392421 RepID=A0A482Y0J4_9EURY|nr:MarR family transcriptional regulator [Natrinema hispanicum]RZV05180.1 hypothetical protein BDK88_4200 [Natrinema hispanicum]
MSDDVAKFLSKKGAIPLLWALAREDGRIVNEINEELDISGQTLSDRIEDARSLEIIEEDFHPADHGNANRYVLSARGLRIYVKCKDLGIFDAYEEFKEARRTYNDRRSKVIDWANQPIVEFRGPDSVERPHPSKIEWRDDPPSSTDGETSDTVEDEGDYGKTETWGVDTEEKK